MPSSSVEKTLVPLWIGTTDIMWFATTPLFDTREGHSRRMYLLLLPTTALYVLPYAGIPYIGIYTGTTVYGNIQPKK